MTGYGVLPAQTRAALAGPSRDVFVLRPGTWARPRGWPLADRPPRFPRSVWDAGAQEGWTTRGTLWTTRRTGAPSPPAGPWSLPRRVSGPGSCLDG